MLDTFFTPLICTHLDPFTIFSMVLKDNNKNQFSNIDVLPYDHPGVHSNSKRQIFSQADCYDWINLLKNVTPYRITLI